jgi:NAD(P)-dependent dehydrogenase (short-subunit alcohol dehydrogenase family)
LRPFTFVVYSSSGIQQELQLTSLTIEAKWRLQEVIMTKEQRTYVITGSASGIGLTTREYLESQGHRVIGADLRDADVIADISDVPGREALVRQVTEQSGGAIDAVLAVAGIDAAGPATVSVNYYGAIATLEGLRPLLVQAKAPRAVAVSSITSVHPYDQQMLNMMLNGTEDQAKGRAAVAEYAYATSKRALSMWIRRRAISAEWADAGIPLNAIAPGLVKTALLSRLFEEPAIERRIRAGTPMPLKGPYDPIATAHLLAFLAGEQNGHMTGQTIFIDGGADAIIRGDSTW